ncbi:uncharacterized protein LOC135465813 [Liolophura sinensis]|uniref:uncharacterized protein LOC135465813 n=1 Tax=Liolophura sinensis TaxID=3198878 RepID=UPI0031587400
MAVQTLTEARLNFLPNTDQVTCYSMKEVKQHCDHTSCWIVFRDRVYDVTAFLEQHPGGTDIILENAGRDVTVTFEEKGHSRLAHEILEQYHIGFLVEHERVETRR